MENIMKKKSLKTIIAIILALCLVAAAVLIALSAYGKKQLEKVPSLSFEEALKFTAKGNRDAVITVGIIKDGNADFSVYGEDGKLLEKTPHVYEIGSLTKTFTAAMIAKAAIDGKIDIENSIADYLPLSEKNTYPSIESVITHTSGYKPYYFESPMIGNFLFGRNDFCGITKSMLEKRLNNLSIKPGDYAFNYSNFGYATLGLVLESVYGTDYTSLFNAYAKDLGLENTKISDGTGDLSNYWDWREQDAYLSAGGATSDINDMLKYASLLLEGYKELGNCRIALETIDATTEQYELLGIKMDKIGMAFIIDSQNGIVWHNGGTGNYNCYLGFCPDKNVAVVVLSNQKPSYRIPATVLGIKLLKELS